MKSLFKYTVCCIFAVLYVFSHIGFGMHSCHTEGVTYFVPLFGDISDEAIHEAHHDHHHDACHNCPHRGTSACSRCHGCDSFSQADECSTVLYVVSDDQNSKKGGLLEAVSVHLCIAFFTIPGICTTRNVNPEFRAVASAPPLADTPALALLSVWRL